MREKFDTVEEYCRKLGHHLSFGYCRAERDGLPCSKVLDCWFQRLPIHDYLQDNFAQDEIAYLNVPPPPKMLTIFQLIQRAQQLNEASP